VDLPAGMDLLARLRAQPGGERLLAAAAPGTFLVGGAVRDLLLGRSPRELDVVVEGGSSVLAHALGTPVEHPRFGTALVELDGARIDVATARRERYPAPGALPEVEPATLDEDLLRRDFTVNAIAVALDGERPGELLAAPGALDDLRGGRLRVLHDASFADDPTRLLRLARYAARLGFEIESHTAELAGQALAADALSTVSRARIGAELRLALSEPDAIAALARMDNLGLFTALHPRLRFDERLAHAALDLLSVADGDTDARLDLLLLAVMLRPMVFAPDDSIEEAVMYELLDELEFAAADRALVLRAATCTEALADQLEESEAPSQIYETASYESLVGIALAGAWAELEWGDHSQAASAASQWLAELHGIRLQITGDDLLAAGVSQGPEVGRRLEAALRAKLDGALGGEGREAELRAALEAV